MTKTSVIRSAILLVGFVLLLTCSAALAQPRIEGDVTVTASSTPVDEDDCPDCPDGTTTRTKICYQVSLANGASNSNGRDFHVKVSDGLDANFVCATIEEFNPDTNAWETVDGWLAGREDQVEGSVRRHYMSWWRSNVNAMDIDRGETFRFCFVYCGSTNNLDNSVEWILTNDGSFLPDDGSDDGNRDDVPDVGNADDPGWSGTKTVDGDDDVGFVMGSCILPDGTCEDDVWSEECSLAEGDYLGDGTTCGSSPIPTVGEWGLIILTLLLLTGGTIVVSKRLKPAAST